MIKDYDLKIGNNYIEDYIEKDTTSWITSDNDPYVVGNSINNLFW